MEYYFPTITFSCPELSGIPPTTQDLVQASSASNDLGQIANEAPLRSEEHQGALPTPHVLRGRGRESFA